MFLPVATSQSQTVLWVASPVRTASVLPSGDQARGPTVEFWLRATPEAQTREEADFIERHLQLPPQGKVLDVPCGGGRHSLALAARGYQVTGIDVSPQFLQTARARANENRLVIDWH